MNSPTKLVRRYNFVRLFVVIIAMYVFFEGILKASMPANQKLVLGMLIGVSIFLFNVFLAKKISSVSCPNCQKPIAVKTKFGKLFTSDSCEYCNREFRKT